MLQDWHSFLGKSVYVYCVTLLSERHYRPTPESSANSKESRYYLSDI